MNSTIFKAFFLSLCILANTHLAYAQNAAILPNAMTTFVDANGKPLASGTVDYYVPGTSTRKTTWQDIDTTIPNTNPVVLNGAGRALIWGNGSYREVVKDKNGNLQWDRLTSSAGAGGSSSTSVGDGLAVGSVIPWAGFVAPTNYAFTYGQELSRTTYDSLFNKITLSQDVTCTSGSPTLTAVADTSQLNVGAAVEGACIPAASTIVSKTVNSVTLNNNALVSTTVSAVFFPFGNGNGTTTFNVPDYRGAYLPGRNNMGGAAGSLISNPNYTDPNAMYGGGGLQTYTLVTANLPPYTPSGTNTNGSASFGFTSNNANWGAGANATVTGITATGGSTITMSTANSNFVQPSFNGVAQGGTSTPFRTLPPSKTVNYVIKIAPDVSLAIAACANLSDAGTACTYNVGTSGNTVPLNNTANVFSANQTFTSGVTISGGSSSITDLVSPVNASDAATKAYVDSVASGLNILATSTLATAAVLPNSPTYSNGALGVGATLTAGSNTTLTVDGTSAPLSTVVLVKNQASAFQNGIYTVTQAGSGGAPWILTRATYFDQAAEMLAGSYTFVTGGATNVGNSFVLQTAVATVGTDALNWSLFTQSTGANVVGTGSSTNGDIALITNSTSTNISGAGYNPTQVPGMTPSTSTVTISNASPGIVSWASHGLSVAAPVFFCTTGTLPTGLTACVPATGSVSPNTYFSNPTLYYVCSGVTLLTNSFAVATTVANAKAGVCVNTSSAGSGTHTAFANAMACTGCIGEYIYNVVSSPGTQVLTTGVDKLWNTISLTAGIWEIGGNSGVFGISGSTTFTHMHASLNYGIGTAISSSPWNATTAWHVTSNNPNGWQATMQPEQIFLTTTTTINATAQVDFSGGGAGMYGKLWARRIK